MVKVINKRTPERSFVSCYKSIDQKLSEIDDQKGFSIFYKTESCEIQMPGDVEVLTLEEFIQAVKDLYAIEQRIRETYNFVSSDIQYADPGKNSISITYKKEFNLELALNCIKK